MIACPLCGDHTHHIICVECTKLVRRHGKASGGNEFRKRLIAFLSPDSRSIVEQEKPKQKDLFDGKV